MMDWRLVDSDYMAEGCLAELAALTLVGPVLAIVHNAEMEELTGASMGSPTTPRCYQDCMVLNLLTRNVGDWLSDSGLKETLSDQMDAEPETVEEEVLPDMESSELYSNDSTAVVGEEEERN